MVSVSRKSRKALLGKKVGMTQIFSEEGKWVPITVLQAGPCAVLQIKTEELDGYSAYQVGFDDRRKDAKRPQQVCFDKLGVNTKHFVREIPFIDPADILTGAPSAAPAEEASEEVAEAPAEEPEEGAESEETAAAEEAAENTQETDSADEGEEQDGQHRQSRYSPGLMISWTKLLVSLI